MATVSKTYTFDSTQEDWGVTVTSPATGERITTDGSPDNGCLNGEVSGRNKGAASNVIWNSTAISLSNIGVPSGATVTAIALHMRNKCGQWNTGNYGDFTPALVFGGTTYSGTKVEHSTTSEWTSDTERVNETELDITTLSTTVQARITADLRTANNTSAVIELRWDNIEVRVTYTEPELTASFIGQTERVVKDFDTVSLQTRRIVKDLTSFISQTERVIALKDVTVNQTRRILHLKDIFNYQTRRLLHLKDIFNYQTRRILHLKDIFNYQTRRFLSSLLSKSYQTKRTVIDLTEFIAQTTREVIDAPVLYNDYVIIERKTGEEGTYEQIEIIETDEGTYLDTDSFVFGQTYYYKAKRYIDSELVGEEVESIEYDGLLIASTTGQTSRIITVPADLVTQTKRQVTLLDSSVSQTKRIVTLLETLAKQTKRSITLKDTVNYATKRILWLLDTINYQTRRFLKLKDVFNSQTRRLLTLKDIFTYQTKRIVTLKEIITKQTRRFLHLKEIFAFQTKRAITLLTIYAYQTVREVTEQIIAVFKAQTKRIIIKLDTTQMQTVRKISLLIDAVYQTKRIITHISSYISQTKRVVLLKIGRYHTHLHFDHHKESRVNVGRPSLIGYWNAQTTAISVSCWINFKEFYDSSNSKLIAGGSYGRPFEFSYRHSNDDLLSRVRGLDDDGITVVNDYLSSGKANIVLNEWNHVGFVYNYATNTHKVFINGQVVATKENALVYTYQDTTVIYFGRSFNYFLHGKAWMRDVRFFDKALSDQEIADIHDGSDVITGLVGHWKVDEGSGVIAVDSSATENDGAIEFADWKQYGYPVTYATKRILTILDTLTYQTKRVVTTLADYIAQTKRVIWLKEAFNYQTQRFISLKDTVAFQTKRFITLIDTTTYQTKRVVTKIAVYSRQTVRNITLKFDYTLQTVRSIFLLTVVAYQTKRMVTHIAIKAYQTLRKLYFDIAFDLLCLVGVEPDFRVTESLPEYILIGTEANFIVVEETKAYSVYEVEAEYTLKEVIWCER